MKIVFIGKVKMSYAILRQILKDKKFYVVGIITDKKKEINSDFIDISKINKKIPTLKVNNINNLSVFKWIKKLNPDYIFCFGYSKLIKDPILTSYKNKIIGFHPTLLPENKGRHPIIWSIALGISYLASTFFLINKKPDSGRVILQKKINILQKDNATTIYQKISKIAKKQFVQLHKVLNDKKFIKKKKFVKKNNFWRKRSHKDGIIDWRMSAIQIDRLIKALTNPYAGASFIRKNKEYKVYSSKILKLKNINFNEPGKVLKVNKNFIVVKTGDYAIKLTNIQPKLKLKINEYL